MTTALEIYDQSFALLNHAATLKDKRRFEESLPPLLRAQQGFAALAEADIPEGARMEGFVLLELGHSLMVLGRNAEAVVALEKVIRRREAAGAPVEAAMARVQLGILRQTEGRLD